MIRLGRSIAEFVSSHTRRSDLQIAGLDDGLSDGSSRHVGVLGPAFGHSERLVDRKLTAAHQDSLGQSDTMPGSHCAVQVFALCHGFQGQTGVLGKCLGHVSKGTQGSRACGVPVSTTARMG